MHQLPALPPGYIAQPIWLRALHEHQLEFVFVYHPSGRIDRERCYWVASTQGPAEAAEVRYVTWGRLQSAGERGAPSFSEFSSYEATLEDLERWFRVAGMELPLRGAREGRTVTDPWPLPWNYLGLRRVGGCWVPVSGYVPSEAEDTLEGARQAAEVLGADIVTLEDAHHHVIAARQSDGTWVDLHQVGETAASGFSETPAQPIF